MKKIKFIPPLLVMLALTLVVAGCGKKTESANLGNTTPVASGTAPTEKMREKNAKTDEKKDPSKSGMHQGTEAKLAGTRIDLQNSNSLKPGKVTLAFKLFGLDAHEFSPTDLKINDGKPMHLILVRDDLAGYQHLYPDYTNELWAITAQIPQAGNYYVYVGIEPTEEKPIVLRVPVVIGEPTGNKKYPVSSPNFSEMVGDVTAQLDLASPIKAGEITKFNVKLTRNNNPVAQLGSHLGTFGHAVVLMHTEPSHFEYIDTLTQEKPTNGVVKFAANFSVDGMYTIFAQFNIDGQTKTFPITVEVGKSTGGSKDGEM